MNTLLQSKVPNSETRELPGRVSECERFSLLKAVICQCSLQVKVLWALHTDFVKPCLSTICKIIQHLFKCYYFCLFLEWKKSTEFEKMVLIFVKLFEPWQTERNNLLPHLCLKSGIETETAVFWDNFRMEEFLNPSWFMTTSVKFV